MMNAEIRYVVCIRHDHYQASLEVRKIYEVLPDALATENQLIRVIDESGEDYLFPESYFVAIELPPSVKEALQLAA